MYFLGFLAFCQFLIPLAGTYAATCAAATMGITGYSLYRIWRNENKEFNPRMAYREFVSEVKRNVKAKVKPSVIYNAPSEIASIYRKVSA